MKRPIAMRCTQEQFDSIKYSIPYEIVSITSFSEHPYLVNNFNNTDTVSNIQVGRPYYKECHQTFNADIFLEACGVDVEVEKQIFQIWQNGMWVDYVGKYRLKPKPDYTAEIAELENKIKELKRKML